MSKTRTLRCSRCDAPVDEASTLNGFHLREIERDPRPSDRLLHTQTWVGEDGVATKTHLIACGPLVDIANEAQSKATAPIRALGRHLDVWESQGDTTVSINFLRRHFGLPSPFIHILAYRDTGDAFVPSQFDDGAPLEEIAPEFEVVGQIEEAVASVAS